MTTNRTITNPCIAYLEDGRICRSPGVMIDRQRGGPVCEAHRPRPVPNPHGPITTCHRCGALYRAGSEEQANEPGRRCPECRLTGGGR